MIGIRAEHRRFAAWALGVLIIALPLWWIWGADLVAAALRPVVSGLLKATGLPGGAEAVEQGWRIGTGFPMADGSGTYVYVLTQDMLRRLLLGFPLLLGFLAAPPRTDRPVRAAIIGVIALSVVFVLSVTAFIWGELAPILNPALAPGGAGPAANVIAQPLHPAIAQTVLLGRYAGASIVPLLTAILVWAAVNPVGRRTVLRLEV